MLCIASRRLAVATLLLLSVLTPRHAAAQPAVGCVRPGETAPRAGGGAGVHASDEDIRGNPAFRCVLHRGQPPVRMVLRTNARYNVARNVQVFGPRSSARPVQVLVLDDANAPPPRGHPFFVGADLNGDGWMDLKVLRMAGATGNELADVFLYSPRARRFVMDTVLSRIGAPSPIAGRPCVRSAWNMGGGEDGSADLCWRGGRWVWVREESVGRLRPGDARLVRTVRELRGGRMRTVRVDTLGGP